MFGKARAPPEGMQRAREGRPLGTALARPGGRCGQRGVPP